MAHGMFVKAESTAGQTTNTTGGSFAVEVEEKEDRGMMEAAADTGGMEEEEQSDKK